MNGRDPFPELTVRSVEADDADRVRRLFERLSPESIYRRFFTLFPAPPASVLRHLTAVDHGDHEALAVLDGDEILALASWDRPAHGSDKTIDVHLSWIRRKLGETPSEPRYLHTVRGVGVRLVAPQER